MDKEILSVWISLVSALTALAAVIAAPIISFWINRRTAIAGHRQAWIENLRQRIAEFLDAVDLLVAEPTPTVIVQLSTARSQILLLVNPNEKLHNELLEKIETAIQISVKNIKNDNGKTEGVSVVRQEIVEVSQKILKEEWNRVKKMKDL